MMPSLATGSNTHISSRKVAKTARIDIYVAGRKYENCSVNTITTQVGVTPSQCELIFDRAHWGADYLDRGASVVVYARNVGYSQPIFRGYIHKLVNDFASAQRLKYMCFDERQYLHDVQCDRNYNIRYGHEDEVLGSEMTVQEIVHDLYLYYRNVKQNDTYSPIFIDVASFPETEVGAVQAFGNSLASVLERLIVARETESARYFISSEYTSGQTRLKCIQRGVNNRPQKRIYRGVDITKAANEHAGGDVSVRHIFKESSLAGVVNRVIARSSRIVKETALELEHEWESEVAGRTERTIAKHYNQYVVKARDSMEFSSPKFLDAAKWVCRRFRIPEVAQTPAGLLDEQELVPSILGKCVQRSPIEDESGDYPHLTPFVVIEYEDGAAAEVLTTGFNIKGNTLTLAEPAFLLGDYEVADYGNDGELSGAVQFTVTGAGWTVDEFGLEEDEDQQSSKLKVRLPYASGSSGATYSTYYYVIDHVTTEDGDLNGRCLRVADNGVTIYQSIYKSIVGTGDNTGKTVLYCYEMIPQEGEPSKSTANWGSSWVIYAANGDNEGYCEYNILSNTADTLTLERADWTSATSTTNIEYCIVSPAVKLPSKVYLNCAIETTERYEKDTGTVGNEDPKVLAVNLDNYKVVYSENYFRLELFGIIASGFWGDGAEYEFEVPNAQFGVNSFAGYKLCVNNQLFAIASNTASVITTSDDMGEEMRGSWVVVDENAVNPNLLLPVYTAGGVDDPVAGETIDDRLLIDDWADAQSSASNIERQEVNIEVCPCRFDIGLGNRLYLGNQNLNMDVAVVFHDLKYNYSRITGVNNA